MPARSKSTLILFHLSHFTFLLLFPNMTDALTNPSSQQGFLGFWRSSVAKVRGAKVPTPSIRPLDVRGLRVFEFLCVMTSCSCSLPLTLHFISHHLLLLSSLADLWALHRRSVFGEAFGRSYPWRRTRWLSSNLLCLLGNWLCGCSTPTTATPLAPQQQREQHCV